MYRGAPVKLGNGTVWSFVRTDSMGLSSTIGVTMTEDALEGLSESDVDTCCGGEETVLNLPEEAPATGIQHIVLNWNPHGHVPRNIYGVPHFDFHFYLIGEKTRAEIKGDAKETTIPTPTQYIPKDYAAAPGAVSHMGVHLVDLKSPEFNGHPFTYTFIYGAYDGRVIFFEPMITLAVLQSHPNVTEPIRQPQTPADAGFQPAEYQIRYDAAKHEITVALTGEGR
jgi:hypothetical protein